MINRSLVAAICLVLVSALAYGQQSQGNSNDLQGSIEKLSQDAAKQYVNPVVTGFGSDLNAGWFHRAPMASVAQFDLEFGVVAMGTVFSDEHKVFNTNGQFQFNSSQAGTLVDQINDPSYTNLPQP